MPANASPRMTHTPALPGPPLCWLATNLVNSAASAYSLAVRANSAVHVEVCNCRNVSAWSRSKYVCRYMSASAYRCRMQFPPSNTDPSLSLPSVDRTSSRSCSATCLMPENVPNSPSAANPRLSPARCRDFCKHDITSRFCWRQPYVYTCSVNKRRSCTLLDIRIMYSLTKLRDSANLLAAVGTTGTGTTGSSSWNDIHAHV